MKVLMFFGTYKIIMDILHVLNGNMGNSILPNMYIPR